MRQQLGDSRAWPLLGALVAGGILLYLLGPILTPFLAGALLAYLGDPLADRLEALGLSRTLSVVVVFVGLSLVLLGVILLLVPMLGRQIGYLQSRLPVFIDWIQATALPWLELNLGLNAEQFDLANLRAALSKNWQSTGNIAATLLAQISSSGLALLAALANLALIPIVAFYLLRDWDVLMTRIRELLPRRMEPRATRLARDCNEVVAAFLRGQLLVMLSLGVFYSVGLWLVGLNLALLIGMLAGLASIVPYLGFIVGIAAASLATVFQFSDWLLPLGLVWGVYLLGQALEGMVLTPLLVGDRIGLHPVAVIFAVLAGGQLFGFAGVLMALPLAAVAMVLVRHAHERYLASELYRRSHDMASSQGEPEERH